MFIFCHSPNKPIGPCPWSSTRLAAWSLASTHGAACRDAACPLPAGTSINSGTPATVSALHVNKPFSSKTIPSRRWGMTDMFQYCAMFLLKYVQLVGTSLSPPLEYAHNQFKCLVFFSGIFLNFPLYLYLNYSAF